MTQPGETVSPRAWARWWAQGVEQLGAVVSVTGPDDHPVIHFEADEEGFHMKGEIEVTR